MRDYIVFAVAVAAVLLYAVYANAAGEVPPVEMTCQLSEDIVEAAETRAIYLVGVYERTTSVVEKTTLAVEINGLWNLKVSAADWQLENCRR